MFERHHLIHYDFSSMSNYSASELIDSKLSADIMPVDDKDFDTDRLSRPMENADFNLSGFADVLPFFPQPSEDFSRYMYVQSFSYMESNSSYYTSRSNYESYLLCYTHAGCGSLNYGEHDYTLTEGGLFIINCMHAHSYRTNGDKWMHSDLHVSGDFLSILYDEFIEDNGGICIKRNIGDAYLKELDKLLEIIRTPSKHRGMMISNQIENLIVSVINADTRTISSRNDMHQIIEYLVQYIQHHYNENLSLDFLSRFSGISKYYLSRIFHDYTGFSPNEYIIQIRMEHSRFLLTNTQLPIKTICQMVGLENEAYFSRLFKSRNGVSPGEFRNTH